MSIDRERAEGEKMSAPPVGAMQQAAIGNSPYANPGEVLNIACVLTGRWPQVHPKLAARFPDLGERYVEHLYAMVSRFAPVGTPWTFTCFTDRLPHHMPDIPTRKLPEHIDGWFNKLYLFSPDAFPEGSRVLYFDLDTAIVGTLTALAGVRLDVPVFLRDVWAASHAASGLFSFRAGPALYPIWTEFALNIGRRRPFASPRPFPMAKVPGWGPMTQGIHTDEQWLHHYIYPNGWAAWQDLVPGACLSYKYDVKGQNRDKAPPTGLTPDARVVFFHGLPRPHDVVAPWNPHFRGIHDPPQAEVAAHRIDTKW